MGIVPNTEFTVSFSKYPSIKAKKNNKLYLNHFFNRGDFLLYQKLNITSQRMASAGDVSKKTLKQSFNVYLEDKEELAVITSSEYVAYDTFTDRKSIFEWLKSNKTIYSNQDDYVTVINHLCDYKEKHSYSYGQKEDKKCYSNIYGHFLEIMIPDLKNEEKHTFIKNYMSSLHPCYKLKSFLYCYKFTKQGKGNYIQVLCFTRKYFKRKQEKKLKYNRDFYWNPNTKKISKKDDIDAVLLHKKGDVKKDIDGNTLKETFYVSPVEEKVFKYRTIKNLRNRLVKIIEYVKLLKDRDYWKHQIKYFSRITIKKSSFKNKEKLTAKNQMIARINASVINMQEALYKSKYWYDVERSFHKLIHHIDKTLYQTNWHDPISGNSVYLGTNQSVASIKDNLTLFENFINQLLNSWWNDEIYLGFERNY